MTAYSDVKPTARGYETLPYYRVQLALSEEKLDKHSIPSRNTIDSNNSALRNVMLQTDLSVACKGVYGYLYAKAYPFSSIRIRKVEMQRDLGMDRRTLKAYLDVLERRNAIVVQRQTSPYAYVIPELEEVVRVGLAS